MSDNVNVPQKGHGCLFYGCLTCSVLLLIVGLVAFFAVRYVKNQINTYTASAPMTLKKVQMSDAEFQSLQERVNSFNDALKEGKATEPLVLTERDINAYFNKNPELKDKVYVSLNGDEVKGQVSIPLSKLGWLGKGRYLNGEATFKVSLENGEVNVNITDIQANGKSVPESVMKSLRNENWAREAAKDPKNAEAMSKFESIQVEDSRVTVKAKPPPQ